MELKVLIVDDEQYCVDDIISALAGYSDLHVIGQAHGIEDARCILATMTPDIVFLDIDLAGDNGFELAKDIVSSYSETSIIFLTGHTDLALEGYAYHPADYLIKPIDQRRLSSAINEVRKRYSSSGRSESVGVRTDGGFVFIKVNDILYIEKKGRKSVIHTAAESYYSSESMQSLSTVLGLHGFYRSHQSFLVPLDRITGIRIDDYKNTYLIDIRGLSEPVPLSRDNYGKLKKILLSDRISVF